MNGKPVIVVGETPPIEELLAYDVVQRFSIECIGQIIDEQIPRLLEECKDVMNRHERRKAEAMRRRT